MPETIHYRREGLTHLEISDMMTRPDVADLLGTSPQAVVMLSKRRTRGFPEPVVVTRQGAIYSRREVEAWKRLEDAQVVE